jgi:hypothetical protein
MLRGSVALPIVLVANVAAPSIAANIACTYTGAYRATIGPRGPIFFHLSQYREKIAPATANMRTRGALTQIWRKPGIQGGPRPVGATWGDPCCGGVWQGDRNGRPQHRGTPSPLRLAAGRGFFCAAAHPRSLFIPLERATATRTFLLRESLFNYLLQRFICGIPVVAKVTGAAEHLKDMQQ